MLDLLISIILILPWALPIIMVLGIMFVKTDDKYER